jgi:hypothetical protein
MSSLSVSFLLSFFVSEHSTGDAQIELLPRVFYMQSTTPGFMCMGTMMALTGSLCKWAPKMSLARAQAGSCVDWAEGSRG